MHPHTHTQHSYTHTHTHLTHTHCSRASKESGSFLSTCSLHTHNTHTHTHTHTRLSHWRGSSETHQDVLVGYTLARKNGLHLELQQRPLQTRRPRCTATKP